MSQPTWLAELPELVEAFSIESPGAFTLFGSPYRTPAPEDAVPTTNSLLSAPAQTGLADALYLALHCRFAQGSDRYRDPIGARDFAESVARSSAGVGPWQPGWTVRAIEPDGRIVAEKYGVLFWLAADRFRGDGGSPAPNQRGWVRIPGKFETLSGGFHMVLGDGDDEAEIEPLVRIYWHLTAAGAARLTRTLTSRLDGAAIPFRFKTGSDPIRYHRTDAAVLYLARRRYLTALPVIAATYLEIADALRRPVSALVRPLAPGLGRRTQGPAVGG